METIEQSQDVKGDIPSIPFSPLYSPPTSPSNSKPFPSASQTTGRPRVNALSDLIESEKVYVSDLKTILQRVTSCWDIDNLPPTEIDKMFRLIEGIYKRNRKFCTKLVKIGVNPNKELGDILMTWVNDMEKPYTNFCKNYKGGFDQWPEIKENTNLQQTLNDMSIQRNQLVTLDCFFEMPIYRLYYYKKFYLRLLKSTDPEKSDHDPLENANKRIDDIIKLIEKTPITINTNVPILESNKKAEFQAKVVTSNTTSTDIKEITITPTDSSPLSPTSNNTSLTTTPITPITNLTTSSSVSSVFTTSTMTSTYSSGSSAPSPSTTTNPLSATSETFSMPITPINNTSPIPTIDAIDIKTTTNTDTISFEQDDLNSNASPVKSPIDVKIEDFSSSLNQTNFEITINNLETIIDDSKAIDLFTKQLKNAKLVLLPPNLPFNRQILLHHDIVIEIPDFDEHKKPIKTLLEVHLFILTDLILICQINEDEDKAKYSNFAYCLLFAPISLRNLMIKDLSDDQGDMLEIMVPERGSFVVYSNNTENHKTLCQIIAGAIMFVNKATAIKPLVLNNNLRKVGSNPQLHNSSLSASVLRKSPSADILSLNSNKLSSNDNVEAVESWHDNDWKPLTKKDNCIVEVRLTTSNKGCWAIILPKSSKMVLNAWIHANTRIHQENPTCINISCETAQKNEFYRIKFSSTTDAILFHSSLMKVKQYDKELSPVTNQTNQGFMSRSSSLQGIATRTTSVVVDRQQKVHESEQQVSQVMESKCRLFLQNDHGVWTNLGWGQMKISLETPSYRKRIVVNSDKQKTKLIDSIIWEGGVERVGKAGVAITINSTNNATNRAIYMLQMKDEKTAIKTCDIMKNKQPNL
ncbi:11372_t:CDS:10 [Entrophospora sp. SA101]|nr:15846_t:CDS:10 [Entrophospora sp. SA101]CAJ0637406.1 11372_t:CDS:10 [Entrophospora sp. SA101]CAJ0831502.1 12684_t:CDS:10 [Entrophospora sp. SA101]CAJ0840551.1 9582_t:CDS:10 [Entrophospora sp. SA101]